jgi:hypothetical protein
MCFSGANTLYQLLRELHASIAPAANDTDESADNTRGTLLLEVYALEIQMHEEMKNNKKLRVRWCGPQAPTYQASTHIVFPWPGSSGDLRQDHQRQVGYPTSEDYGRYPRVWRQDAHVGECVWSRLIMARCYPRALK